MKHHCERLAASIVSGILPAQEAVTEPTDIGNLGSRELPARLHKRTFPELSSTGCLDVSVIGSQVDGEAGALQTLDSARQVAVFCPKLDALVHTKGAEHHAVHDVVDRVDHQPEH